MKMKKKLFQYGPAAICKIMVHKKNKKISNMMIIVIFFTSCFCFGSMCFPIKEKYSKLLFKGDFHGL